MPKTFDVAVIGAGVFGAWTAYVLTRSGARVLLLDQHGPANSRASSAGETRIIRMSYGADEIYTRAALRSLAVWKQFFADIGQTLFHQTGVLVTAGGTDPYLSSTRETLARGRVKFEWLESAALRARFPQIVFDRRAAAVFEPSSGVLMARQCVQAVVDAGVRSGAQYRPWRAGTPTESHIVPTSGGAVHAGQFVYACGPWLPALFPRIVGGRIRPTRQQVFFFGTPPGDRRFEAPQTPAWIAFREGVYALPALDGRGFKIAVDHHGPRFDPEAGDRNIDPRMLARVRATLRTRFPGMAGAPLVESRVCQYENTWNGDFLIDRHPEFDNVWLAGGGSGHGFKHGPFVAEYLAAQMAGAAAAEPRFSLATKKTGQRRAVY